MNANRIDLIRYLIVYMCIYFLVEPMLHSFSFINIEGQEVGEKINDLLGHWMVLLGTAEIMAVHPNDRIWFKGTLSKYQFMALSLCGSVREWHNVVVWPFGVEKYGRRNAFHSIRQYQR